MKTSRHFCVTIFGLSVLLTCTYSVFGQVRLWDTTGVAVCTADGWQRAPRLTPDGSGGAIIAWEDLRSGSQTAIYAARILPTGILPWRSNGVEVSPPGSGTRRAGLLEDGDGGAFLAWWSTSNGHSDIFAQRIDKNGALRWINGPLRVCGAPGDQQWAEMIADGEGGVIIAWHDGRGNDNDIYAQRITADGTVLWTENGVAVSTATGDQSYPQLASNRNGGAFIAWMDRRTEDDIYMQHVLSDGTLHIPEDVAVCVEPNRQVAPKVGQFGDDKVVVFWQDYRLGTTTSALYLQIFDDDGQKTYVEDYQVTQSDKSQSGMMLTSDGQRGSLAVWADFRKAESDGDIYMRRINADGSIIGDFGNAMCDATGTQERPQMINDGFGGAFAVWQDKRNTFDYDLYMNRISAQGTTNYTDWNRHSGMLLHKADNNQLSPQVVSSTVGTAIIVWYDGRVLDGQAYIYAQRVAWAPSIVRPDSVTFGLFKTGLTVFDTLTIKNNGPLPLLITNIRRDSDPATTHPGDFTWQPTILIPYTLQPDSSVDLVTSFKPGGIGRRISELRISSNAPEDPAVINLIGIGTNPRLETPSVHQFAVTKPGQIKEEELQDFISNTGSGTLVLHRIEITGRDSMLFSNGNNPPFPIEVPEQQSISLRLRFAPDSVGPKEATLRLFHNGDSIPRSVRLSGIAALPTMLTSPITQYFDTTMATATQEAQIRIRNTSGVELVVSDLVLAGDDPGEFSVQATLPMLIPGDASDTFLLRFHPTSAGLKRAELIIVSDAPSSPDSLRINGPATPLSIIEAPSATDFALHSLYPNPVSLARPFTVGVRLPASSMESLHLRLTDILGREHEIWTGTDIHGANLVIPVSLRDSGIAPGHYTITAELRKGRRILRTSQSVLILP